MVFYLTFGFSGCIFARNFIIELWILRYAVNWINSHWIWGHSRNLFSNSPNHFPNIAMCYQKKGSGFCEHFLYCMDVNNLLLASVVKAGKWRMKRRDWKTGFIWKDYPTTENLILQVTQLMTNCMVYSMSYNIFQVNGRYFK